jgi:hypothetical protein
MDDSENSDSDSNDDSDSSSASDASSSDLDSDDSSSDSDSDSDSDASRPPDVKSSKDEHTKKTPALSHSPNYVVPGLGRSDTHRRNARRTQTKRLRHFKEDGKLGPDADLRDLARYEAAHGLAEPGVHVKPFSTYAGKKRQIEDDETMEDDDATEEVPELEHRKHELMARFGEVPADIVVQAEEGSQAPREPTSTETLASPKRTADDMQPAKQTTPRKRLRPDTAAIGRMLARQAMVGIFFLS